MELNALKEVWKCREGKMGGLLPNSRFGLRQSILCCDRVFQTLCRDMAFCVATWSLGQVHNLA